MVNLMQKIGVAQKAIIVNKEGKILVLKRSATAPSRPLHWDLPGGDLDYGEDMQAGILREINEETGLTVNDLELFEVISGFNDKKEFWVTVCYTAEVKNKKPNLSYEHIDFKWVTPSEFQKLKASPRNKRFVEFFKNQ